MVVFPTLFSQGSRIKWWIRVCCRFPETKLWKVQGVDAVFYLRALKLYLILTVGMNIGSLIVLLPIDLTAKQTPSQSTNSTLPANNTTGVSSSGGLFHTRSDYYLDEGTNLDNATASGMARFTMASLMHGMVDHSPRMKQSWHCFDRWPGSYSTHALLYTLLCILRFCNLADVQTIYIPPRAVSIFKKR